MKATLDIVPRVTVHPDSINLYSEVIWSPRNPYSRKTEHLLKSNKHYGGKVSDQTRRKVAKGINYLLFIANSYSLPASSHGKQYNFKIAFITLTLPSKQVHSDNEIKEKCLNQFLIELSSVYKVSHYVWRAEKQANGNIHFHLLVNKFIPWSQVRDRWNRITNKLGYVDRYRDEMRRFHSSGFNVRQDLLRNWEYKKQVKAYQVGKAQDWASPNSTDIHALHRINKVSAYLAKYCTKDEEENVVNGRIWGCSTSLSNIKGGSTVADNEIKDEINKLLVDKSIRVYRGDYFTVCYISVHDLLQRNCEHLYNLFSTFMLEHFKYHCPPYMAFN